MKDETVIAVCTALKKARLKKELSQDQLSEASGVDRAYISRLEAGSINPSFRVIGKLAAALGMKLKITIT